MNESLWWSICEYHGVYQPKDNTTTHARPIQQHSHVGSSCAKPFVSETQTYPRVLHVLEQHPEVLQKQYTNANRNRQLVCKLSFVIIKCLNAQDATNIQVLHSLRSEHQIFTSAVDTKPTQGIATTRACHETVANVTNIPNSLRGTRALKVRSFGNDRF